MSFWQQFGKWIIGGLVLIGIVFGISSFLAKEPVGSGGNNNQPADSTEVTEKDWVKGNAAGKLTLIEYGDFQCPSCKAYYPMLKQLMGDFPNDLRIVFRQFPLTTIHKNAWLAAMSAEAAGQQGKFWEMHDKLFESQDDWANATGVDKVFVQYAGELGLDTDKFAQDLKSKDLEAKVSADQNSGFDLGVTGTPSFYLNGEKLPLVDYAQFKAILSGEAAKVTPAEVKVHEHADLAMFDVNGRKINFSQASFMEKHPDIHFHDNNGDIVHKHKRGATMGQFLESIGQTITDKTVWYVNGNKMNISLKDYEFKEADRIAIGVGELTGAQLDMVEDKACIYSETCPERGKPPTENCVGGVGTDCEVEE